MMMKKREQNRNKTGTKQEQIRTKIGTFREQNRNIGDVLLYCRKNNDNPTENKLFWYVYSHVYRNLGC